jgi:O-acetyl-ADP-ribose deacetylase (regulator of RNase III)
VRIISDKDAIENIIGEPGRWAFYLGAGLSVESGVPTAQQISADVRAAMAKRQPELSPDQLDRELEWSSPARRYPTCIRRGFPNEERRLSYFRSIVRDAEPAFCHYAVALLMSQGYARRTCLTTNFDHLLEMAFARVGIADSQAIRDDFEADFWHEREGRFFILKLHGDIDTLNIRNTREETISISERMQRTVERVAEDSGLVILGSAGNEKSVRALFDDIGRRDDALSLGLLWGVFMGTKRPERPPDDVEALVRRKLDQAEINEDIVNVIGDSRNQLFSFFPIWGAGEFLLDLVRATERRDLVAAATQRLDHEMRLRHIFRSAGLSEDAVEQHLASLRKKRKPVERAGRGASGPAPDQVASFTARDGQAEIRVLYGDITSRSLMGAAEFRERRRAVVSPEDTLISAGGGVAYQLLAKAGSEAILNELAKFGPIAQGTVAVTSAGALPVHYIIHAAALEIREDASYAVSGEAVRATMLSILDAAAALRVGCTFVPLLGAGVASLEALESLQGLMDGAIAWLGDSTNSLAVPMTIAILVYEERLLPRGEVLDVVRDVAQLAAPTRPGG